MPEAASCDERPERAGGGTHVSLCLGDQLGWHDSTVLSWPWGTTVEVGLGVVDFSWWVGGLGGRRPPQNVRDSEGEGWRTMGERRGLIFPREGTHYASLGHWGVWGRGGVVYVYGFRTLS